MTKPLKPAPRTSRNTALPACTGDPLIDHAVTVMDLSGFKNRISRKILATALFEVRKIGTLTTKLEHWSKEIGINSHYLQTAFTVLQEFGLLVREMDGGLKYFVDEHRLRNPSTVPVKRVRRQQYGTVGEPENSGLTQCKAEKPDKITPRTRCVECGAKVEFFADRVKHICMVCDLRRQQKGYRG